LFAHGIVNPPLGLPLITTNSCWGGSAQSKTNVMVITPMTTGMTRRSRRTTKIQSFNSD
jgi:hypothetical protein